MRTKRFIFSIIALAIAMTAGAQNEMSTAILQSGETVTMFTGSSALVDAHAAAQNGDVITLSAGEFIAPTAIEKSISIYGAGYEVDNKNGTNITVVSGNMAIGVFNATLENVHIEGICFRNNVSPGNSSNGGYENVVNNVQLVKCHICGGISFPSNFSNVLVSQCVVDGIINGNHEKGKIGTNLMVNNCHISNMGYFTNGSSVIIKHSITTHYYFYYGDENCAYTWDSCIFAYDTGWTRPYVGKYCTVRNCIYINNSGINGEDTPCNMIDCFQVNLSEIFADGADGSYSSTRTFVLQKPDVWKDKDGEPVGPSGGIGWNKVPSTPVLKNLKTRVDGATLQVTYTAEPR